MELVKINTKHQVDQINELLLDEPSSENTRPFFIETGSLESNVPYFLVHDKKVVGVSVIKDFGDRSAEIYKLYIFRSCRDRGVGTLAVEKIISTLKSIDIDELYVEALALDVIPFWNKLNFNSSRPEHEGYKHLERKI